MKDKVKIIVYTNDSKFLNYLVYNRIIYESLIKYDEYYILEVNYEYFNKINKRYNTKVIKYYGIKFFINIYKTHKYMIYSFIFGIMLIMLLESTIIDINVNTSDTEIKNKIISSLNDYDLVKYKKKKSFNELQVIKDKILNDNEDILEWIEIVEKGCNYEVNLTERIKSNKNIKNKNKTNIIASKDGLIKYITSSSGVKLKDVNDYVKKGEIIISGNIMKSDDKIAYQVESLGKVYAEVWYLVNISIPYNYKEYAETGKVINHYYVKIFNKEFTLTGKYESNNTISEKHLILDKPYLFFKLYKETKKEYEYKSFSISVSKAYNEAIRRSEIVIKKSLNDDEYIISKKVLKKEEFRSKINVEVFYKVYENIASTSNIDNVLGEKNGKSVK